MTTEDFERYVAEVDWRFAKSVPNWPHFYIVEDEQADHTAFQAARIFIEERGRDGKFYDLDVRYFDSDGWTYWASPLGRPLESKFMLNRCKTEFSYEKLAESGNLPAEGFRGSDLDLGPVLADPEFRSLVSEAEAGEFTVFDVLGTADYEIRHSNVLSWLLDPEANHRQGADFARLLWENGEGFRLPPISFDDYSVVREGAGEDEKIDLLLRDRGGNWVIVIENKIFATETGNQLDRYFRYADSKFADVPNRIYLYLTPEGISPAGEDDASRWQTMGYLQVKDAVSRFLERDLPPRIDDFLRQYLVHIQRNVLRSVTMTERQRSILLRYPKFFHSFAYVFEEPSVRSQCDDREFSLLKSILAVQNQVEAELFSYTRLLIGNRRHSGLGHWVTLKIDGVREWLIGNGWLSESEPLPIIFAFDSRPHSYRVEIWLYKKMPLYRRTKGRLRRFSEEGPEPNRGDEHLVEVLFRRTIIDADQIVRESLSELKARISDYFESGLAEDLRRSKEGILSQLEALR